MKIRFERPNCQFPVLLTVDEVSGSMTVRMFRIEFHSKRTRYVLSRELNGEEDAKKAERTFDDIQSSLALNDYANLVAGEITSLISYDWEWSVESTIGNGV